MEWYYWAIIGLIALLAITSVIKWGMRAVRFILAMLPIIGALAVFLGAGKHRMIKTIIAIFVPFIAIFFAWRWIWSGTRSGE